MSDDGFWDIDQFLTTRRNQPVGAARVVDPMDAVVPIHDSDGGAQKGVPVARHPPGGGGQQRRRRLPRDIAELHGLDEAALEPTVRAVLADLIREIGHLHEDLRLAEGRIDYLDSEVRHDTLGPWLGRAAFLGQLSRLQGLDRSEDVSSAVALFRILGFRAMRRTHGWEAADDVAIRFGRLIVDQTASPVGHIGDDLFGVLLPGMAVEEARRFADRPVLGQVNGPVGADPLTVARAAALLHPHRDGLAQLSSLERGLALSEADRRDDVG